MAKKKRKIDFLYQDISDEEIWQRVQKYLPEKERNVDEYIMPKKDKNGNYIISKKEKKLKPLSESQERRMLTDVALKMFSRFGYRRWMWPFITEEGQVKIRKLSR